MFYGAYEIKGYVGGGFYTDYEEWRKDTFCADVEIIAMVDMQIHGSTYAERKADVERVTHEYLDLYANSVPMSCGEVVEWQAYFEEQGKRYGLLEIFRENAII